MTGETIKVASNVTASGIVGSAVPGGQTFYCNSINVSGFNNSAVNAGQWTITDGNGGAVKAAGNLPAAIQGVCNYNAMFPTPILFSTSVWFNVVAGSVTAGITCVGLEG